MENIRWNWSIYNFGFVYFSIEIDRFMGSKKLSQARKSKFEADFKDV